MHQSSHRSRATKNKGVRRGYKPGPWSTRKRTSCLRQPRIPGLALIFPNASCATARTDCVIHHIDSSLSRACASRFGPPTSSRRIALTGIDRPRRSGSGGPAGAGGGSASAFGAPVAEECDAGGEDAEMSGGRVAECIRAPGRSPGVRVQWVHPRWSCASYALSMVTT